MPTLPPSEVALVRALAEQYRELASSEEFEARRRRWRDANERRPGERAPVWLRPDSLWLELVPESTLQCTDDFCRDTERALRRELYHAAIGDDHVFDPWWGVPACFDCATEYPWGLRTNWQVETTDLGGFRYEHAVKTEADYDLLTVPAYTYNPAQTEADLTRMADLLGEALPVRLTCAPPLPILTLGHYLENLRGMAEFLADLAFHPELVHRAMAKFLEGCLASLRAAEATGLLTPNHTGPLFCSDPLGETPADGKLRLHNLWSGANSQEFQTVSPRMQEEFLLNYQIPLLAQFGATWYGCCEDLSQKISLVLRIPNLRIFVSSYWTDLDKVIAACGDRYTIMWRQLSAMVVFADDLEPIRKHLETGMQKLQGLHYQVVLRELETLQGHPRRLQEWAALAKELGEKYA
jgi:hypothetical protein